MTKHQLLRGLGLSGALTFATWACSHSSDQVPFENGAGRASGGADTAAEAGAGGAYDDECPGRQSLKEYCRTRACPESPQVVDLSYCDSPFDFPRVTQRESSCGGVSVIFEDTYEVIRYHFDADDHLVGIDGGSDSLSQCEWGGVGATCTLQGAETTLCGDFSRCAAVELRYLCNEPDACSAFESQQMLQDQLCGAADTVARFDSTCNGSLYRHHSGTTVSEWSFDTEGQLVGATVTTKTAEACFDGGYSKMAVFGQPCEAVGGGADACDGPIQLDTCNPAPLADVCQSTPERCPVSPEATTASGCPGSEVLSYASDCGGVLVVAEQDVFGSIAWSFDANGTLTGIVYEDDVGNDCDELTFSFKRTYGENCKPVGTGELLCGTNFGGEGGAGN